MTDPQRRQRNHDRLRRETEGPGRLLPGDDHDDGLGSELAPPDYKITHTALPPDERPANTICAVCLRSPRRLHRSPDGYLWCPSCSRQPQVEPGILLAWAVKMPREVKRQLFVLSYGVDPATWNEATGTVTFTTVHGDIDGLPTEVAERPHGKIDGHANPRCFWDERRERRGMANRPPRDLK